MIDIREDEPLWCEKYRPQKIADVILPKELKAILQGYVNDGLVPNLILSGGPGVGKTTAARAMFTEMGVDYYFINSSMNGNIDTLRTDIADFASSVSFSGKRKYVLLDEADYLNPNSTQPALRGVIEEFSRNCGFLLTCNYPIRLLEALRSRCPVVEFSVPVDEREPLAVEFFSRICQILKMEGIKFSEAVVAAIIEQHFPDWRKIINTLQNSVKDRSIGTGALAMISDEDIRKLYGYLKSSNFGKVREWCAQYGSDHPKDLFRSLYGMAADYLELSGQAQLAISINKYEYNAAFVANQEINLVAAMVEIMTECEFKNV